MIKTRKLLKIIYDKLLEFSKKKKNRRKYTIDKLQIVINFKINISISIDFFFTKSVEKTFVLRIRSKEKKNLPRIFS